MVQSDVTNWADVADDWIAWVRTEDHDAFWAYRAAFERFVGPGSGSGVEIGAGEGRICRVLQGLGYDMTAVEPVPAFLEAARAEGSAQRYIQASAKAICEDDGMFDLVVLYNVLMDVDDLEASVREAARLLASTGRMIVGIVHPIFDVYMAAKSDAPLCPYFDPQAFDAQIETDGLRMRFRGWSRPLCAYVNALADAGLTITRMEEPRPDPDHPATRKLPERNSLPTFLWLELRKPPIRSVTQKTQAT